MIEPSVSPVSATGELTTETTALQLFQIAALMLGDEQGAVSLVEETLAGVEADPCANGTLAFSEARTLLAQAGLKRIETLHPGALAAPATLPIEGGCIDTESYQDDLASTGSFGALLAGTDRAGMREQLDQIEPVQRAIFALRAVAGLDSEQTAQCLRQSGGPEAAAWRRDLVTVAYRQALCSLATSLMSSSRSLLPA
jgi:hypothetical protein